MDILFFGAHPDDVEIACAGTILKYMDMGKQIGIIDLTAGEMGTRGSAESRKEEVKAASKVLGINIRENLGLPDAFIDSAQETQMIVIDAIRKHRPKIVIAPAIRDRHPDHGNSAKLVSEACFKSGLVKIKTDIKAWRPNAVYNFTQDRYIEPDFVIDISSYIDKKMEAILCYKSQFFQPDSKEPETPISGENFQDYIKMRAVQLGRPINAKYAEGYTVERPIGIEDITTLL